MCVYMCIYIYIYIRGLSATTKVSYIVTITLSNEVKETCVMQINIWLQLQHKPMPSIELFKHFKKKKKRIV